MMKRASVFRILASLAFLLLAGCDDGEPNTTSTDEPVPCTTTDGCPVGTFCVEGFCEDTCLRGTADCACTRSGGCSQSAEGEQLACIEGICGQLDCPEGALGCDCGEGATCDTGLFCNAASGAPRCEPESCQSGGVPEVGTLDCGCKSDRTCDEGLCAAGLCTDLECTPGTLGCVCNTDYSCGSGLTCDLPTGLCAQPGVCTRGNLGCDCKANGSCLSGFTCREGTCQDATCPAGGAGCACRDGACGDTATGEPLLCNAGVCEQSGCPAGDLGCVCQGGEDCNDDAICVDGYCKATDCTPGTTGCDCLAGSCKPGLSCEGSVCIDQTGRIGGPCFDNNTCMRNARCDTSVGDETCVYCDLGTLGCQCQDDDSCNPGLACTEGHCVGDETVHSRTEPDNPKCYTPCSRDLDDATLCDADGLLEGCADGLECTEGSCVPTDGDREMCFEDADCADFQLCIKGFCYSECEQDSDCDAGLACHAKVCRKRCTLSASSCSEGLTCESSDGQTGFCLPRAESAGGSSAAPPPEGFELSNRYVRMSNVTTETRITFENFSDKFVTFTVTKNEHRALMRNGSLDEKRRIELDGEACTGADCPLWWLELGEFGQISQDPTVEVKASPNCVSDDSCPVLFVRLPTGGGVDAIRWTGDLTIESPLGTERIELEYTERPEGQWDGKMVYFATFDDNGIDSEQGIGRGWLARDRDYVSGQPGVNTDLAVVNGLLLRWQAFRTGGMTGGWAEFKAVLTATEAEQWRFPSVKEDCRLKQGACYLYADNTAFALPRDYVTSVDNSPIPTGATTFPMVFNLHIPDENSPEVLTGRVDSNTALHYAGNPAVALRFQNDPGDTNGCDADVTSNCVHFLEAPVQESGPKGLELEVAIGGRFPKPSNQSCPQGFEEHTEPWLIPGFLGDARPDGNGFFQRTWCVDYRLPDYTSPIADILPEIRVDNSSLSRGNPIPDGQVLYRTVELLDGAMIDQSQLFLLFRERYPSFLGGEDLVAYGYMVLSRKPTDLDLADDNGNGTPDTYEGTVPPQNLSTAGLVDGVSCSRDILDEALGSGRQIQSRADAAIVVGALIEGSGSGAVSLTPPTGNDTACTTGGVEVHYLCEDTGLFNGGSGNTACWGSGYRGPNTDSCTGNTTNGICDDGGLGSRTAKCAIGTDVTDCGFRYNDTRTPCPLESNVVFFTAWSSQHNTIRNHVCQQTGTCGKVLGEWAANGSVLRAIEPKWACEPGRTSCDSNVLDRREGKIFFDFNADVPFTAMRPEIDSAFRYKTRFVNREGTGLGFTPSICIPFSEATPYCYDPDAIEMLKARTDCLLDIYETWYSDPANQHPELYAYLEESFSRRVEPNPVGGLPNSFDGFEKLYAELLIMLGDEAYTASFESRFDLAGLNLAGFEGDKFEDAGINVSGIAGFEMYRLHQAVQYYSMALDRFYKMSDVIAAALASGSPATAINFLSADTVTSYFERLIRASTQRSRAWAEIAQRYQAFNRPDLARRVAIRAYTITYLESIALSNIILELYDLSGGTNKPQILLELETAQRRYKMALLDLGKVYLSITDEVSFFGFPPDYIPFPALGTAGANADVNAFDYVYRLTQSKLDAAKAREVTALSQTREFDTDEASFQAELTRIAQTYENQLAEVCGLFTGEDGRPYPAIKRYAYLDPLYATYEDPCGWVGNGAINTAIIEADIARIEVERILNQMQNVHERIRIQKRRVERTCDVKLNIADFQYRVGGLVSTLDSQITSSQQRMEIASQTAGIAQLQSDALDCDPPAVGSGDPGDCPGAISEASAKTAAATALLATTKAEQTVQNTLQFFKSELELQSAKWVAGKECKLLDIELNAETATMLLELTDLQIALISAEYRVALALSEISKLRQQAQRIQLEQDETLDLTVSVEAAKNDPNVRIYRNDAVINAEVAFEDALREAYRLTLVYEFYTSTSYAAKEQLFLTRMVAAGDYNLENYVSDIKNAFEAFEEEFGNPDTRVLVVSLRDHVFAIPRVDEDGTPLTNNERATLMREKLLEPERLNKDGYITLPFATRLDELSPLTRNHKVLYVEANIEGNDNGDYLGRLYLRQVGTSTISSVGDESLFYRFPARTAVINPFFSGTREFAQSPEVYRNYRLRDRPLVNNNWELIINQRDEFVNKDINLKALTDIKLYVFYTDFTVY